jgi:cell division protein ZapA
MPEKKSVTVTIYKNEYTLKGEAEPQHIIDLAQYVDAKMTDLGRKSSAPADKIAILTAMNIADDLRRLEKINEHNLTLIENLEKSLQEIKTASDVTIKNAALQNEESNRLREELSEEKQKFQAVAQQRNQADRLIDELKQQLETLNIEIERMKAGFNGSQQETMELQNALTDQGRKREIAEAEVKNLKNQCELLDLKLADAKESLDKATRFPTPAQLTENDFIISEEKLHHLIKKIETVLE